MQKTDAAASDVTREEKYMIRLIKTMLVGVAALMLLCLVRPAFAFTSVGSTDDHSGPDLASDIMRVYNTGAAGVTINPGTYTLVQQNDPNDPNDVGVPNIELDGITGPFEIDARGVTLILEGNHNGIVFINDTGLTFHGATIYKNAPFGNQGVIQDFGVEGTRAYCDVQQDAGYPTSPSGAWGYCTVLVGNSHAPRVGCPDLVGAGYVDNGNNHIRVYFSNVQNWSGLTIQAGDYLDNFNGGQPLIYIANSKNCTVQDTTFLSSPCESTIQEVTCAGNRYLNDNITYGPPPPGATAAPVRSIGSGLQADDDTVGPDVENCTFEGTGDDGFDLRGDLATVIAISGNTVTVTPGKYEGLPWQSVLSGASSSQPIRLSDLSGDDLDANVTYVTQSTGTNTDQTTFTDYVLTLDQSVPFAYQASADPRASNPAINCPYYRLINDTVRDSRARGVVARGDNGVIQGCDFVNNLLPGILIGLDPGSVFPEGDYSHNVTIQDNVFDNNQGLTIGGHGARDNQNIAVTGNVFANIVGGSSGNTAAVTAQGVSGLTVSDNTFADLGQQTSDNGQQYANCDYAVTLQDSDGVAFADNLLTNPSQPVPNPAYEIDAASQPPVTEVDNSSFAVGIFPGEYVTLANVAAGLDLDDPGYSMEHGVLPQLWTADGVTAQNWQVNWQADGSCTLANQASGGLVLDDTDYGGQGTPQQLWPVDGQTPQEWWIIPAGPTGYTIKNVYAGLDLDDPAYSMKPGQNLQLWPADGATAQVWQVTPAPGFSYTLGSLASSGLLLDDPSYSMSPGTPVQVWTPDGATAQQWELNWQANNRYTLTSLAGASGGLNLGNPSGGGQSTWQAIEPITAGDANQEWMLTQIGVGYYSLTNVATGLCLDDIYSGMQPGNHVWLYPANSGAAQEWSFD